MQPPAPPPGDGPPGASIPQKSGRRAGIFAEPARADSQRAPPAPQGKIAFWIRGLYALTMFASAFLLFVIQPAAGKRLLPALGGAVAVWTSCQAFFQILLVAGYVAAHLAITRLGLARHPLLQGLMGAFGLLAPVGAVALQVPADAHRRPVSYILGELASTLGWPVFLLATLAPTLQAWYCAIRAAPLPPEAPPHWSPGTEIPSGSAEPATGQAPSLSREGSWSADHATAPILSPLGPPCPDRPLDRKAQDGQDPFTLYAASNLGSLAGLLAYPLLIEPWLPLSRQFTWWKTAYVVVALMVLGCGFLVPAASPCRDPIHESGAFPARPSWRRWLTWLGWAFVPSSLTLGLTTQITMDVAPMPLLWVLPLAMYLLSWVLPFSGALAWVQPSWLEWAFPGLFGVAAVVHILSVVSPAWLLVSLALALVFVIGLECHGRLFGDRPAPSHLTGFYLATALGGMLGGGFNTWAAPLLFTRLHEVPLGLMLAAFVFSLARPAAPGSGRRARRAAALAIMLIALLWHLNSLEMGEETWFKLTVLGCAVTVSGLGGWHPGLLGPFFAFLLLGGSSIASTPSGQILAEARSFYGIYRVQASRAGAFHHLRHGNIHHGGQKRLPPEAQRRPMFYYIREGPVGDLFAELRRRRASRIAVVGLGVGTLASYLRPWQEMVFFEIDPLVTRLASNPDWFSFLASAPGRVRVVEGDARLALRDRELEPFDALILDAYSSDAIPLHLLTKEAFELFASRLRPGGMIGLHVSQRYLDLEPVVGNLVEALGWTGLACSFRPDSAALRLKYDDEDMPFVFSSTWLVVAPTPEPVRGLRAHARWRPLRRAPGGPLWTDDHSSILSCYGWE